MSKGNHENIREMWKDGPLSRPVFAVTMPRNWFEEITDCIRFDNLDTRQERRECDKFALFCTLWDLLISQCKKNYNLSEFLCINKQLIPFRGRWPFRQHLPSKPDKYGIKGFLPVDCSTGNICDGIPYTGKGTDRKTTVGLASNVVKQLVEPFYGGGRNITTDNYFTDFGLCWNS